MIYEIGVEDMLSDGYLYERHIDVNCIEHIHSQLEIVYVLDGGIRLTTDENQHLLQKGEMAIVMPYEIHSYETESHSDIIVVIFPPEFINEYRQLFSNQCLQNPVCRINANMDCLLREYSDNHDDKFKTKAIVYYSVSEFMKNSFLAEKKTVEYDVYRKAISYISNHYTEKITLEQTAMNAGVTPTHLSRVLNSRRKSGFSEIVNSLRIFHARRLIEQTSHPISYIAFESGYGSIRNFNRIFNKYFGCNPKDLRSEETGI